MPLYYFKLNTLGIWTYSTCKTQKHPFENINLGSANVMGIFPHLETFYRHKQLNNTNIS